MDRCKGCGAENPGFVSSEPPPRRAYTSDEGTEHALMGLGFGGLLAGARLLVYGAKGAPVWAPVLAGLCMVIGLAALVAFRRVTVSDLSPSAKNGLRGAMGSGALLFAWVYWLAAD